MAYYFAVETEKNNYNAINVKRARTYLYNAYTYDNSFECTLKEIDQITTTFKSEEELRLALINCFSLNSINFDKSFTIFYKDGIESRLISGPILYEDSIDFIEEPNEVIRYIENKFFESDNEFFRQLASTLLDESIAKSLMSKIASLIENNNLTDSNEDLVTLNFVREASKLLIYINHVNEDGNVTYINRINYEKLHSLLGFISSYEKTLNKDNISSLKKIE